jgi:hypothetical protein
MKDNEMRHVIHDTRICSGQCPRRDVTVRYGLQGHTNIPPPQTYKCKKKCGNSLEIKIATVLQFRNVIFSWYNKKKQSIWLQSRWMLLCIAVPTFRRALLPPFARQDECTFDWNVDANVPNYTVPYPNLHSSDRNSALTLYMRPR